MKKNILIFLILLASNSYAQKVDLNIGETKTKNYFEKITFEFVKEKILIPVKIEGKTYRFILDTGSPNVISKEIYDLIKPKLIKSIPISDANGNEKNMDVVLLNKLEIGNVTFEQTATLVYDLNSNPIFECSGADGFIGSNMLRNSIIQIDNKKKTVLLTDNLKNLSVNKKESNKIQLTETQSSPFVWIKFKGKNKGKEQVLIDTGADGIYDIAKDNYGVFREENIFEILGESEGASSIGIFGGASKNTHFKLLLPILEINGTELNNIITETTNDDNSRIGAELLEYGIITIDYINKRFYFSPNTSDKNTAKPDYGFTRTLKDNKLVVGFVWDKSLLTKIKYGDAIIAVNQMELNESNFCEVINQITESKENKPITFKIKSDEGKITDIEIEKKLPPTMYKKNRVE
ncbi:clan AA aspartic protease [Cellulophaga sp. HaHaR_3_176]|uniref:retropepsin-like aspartic protease n=1 Tax=Cellulophaga sp. HaHaR_3_176 TaxID=1942464 RepID=UPI001C1FA50F|nr:retropepsin-like aspartic protease [Cellulophaga sp. HaHaR_3_176]QWX83604.1 clan AA aspartic protease [Cellulophaga sp. HaHaR_3_176]